MIRVRLLASVLCLAACFCPRAADTIQIEEGGQPREFEKLSLRALAETNGSAEIFLVESGRRRTASRRRLVTRDILVKLRPGVGAKAVGKAFQLEAVTPAAPGGDLFLFRVANAGLVLPMVETLRDDPRVVSADPLLSKQRARKFVPGDPLFPAQWHLLNSASGGTGINLDMHLTNTWNSYRGSSVVIGIVDDGLDTGHPDLAPHIDASLGYDWNENDSDPTAHPNSEDFHGTQCAGAAAAVGNNGQGVAGVAFEATLAGLRLIGGFSNDQTEAAAIRFRNQQIHVKSNSWGPDDDGETVDGPGPLALAALEESAREGRGGKGTIFVWAGGNGLDVGDDANYDGYANSIYTIAVTSASDQGLQTDFSEPGACLVVAAPGGSIGRPSIVTTDLRGDEGLNRSGAGDLADLDYTSGFTGTSASVALVSGAVALILEANPNLGWRDVQEVLLRSARKISEHDPDWALNSAGFHFNHKFGAGFIDVDAAVGLAMGWKNLGAQTNLSSAQPNLNIPIPDNNPSGVIREFDFSRQHIRLEHVTLTANIAHPSRGHLAITLISPSGVESRLAEKHGDLGANYLNWKFMSVRHWGESAQGIWKVRIADVEPGETGRLNSLSLDLFGTADRPANQLGIKGLAFSEEGVASNNNGGVEPGETAATTVLLENLGGASLSGAIRLISRTRGVTVLSPEKEFSEVQPGGLKVLGPFLFQLSEGVPCDSTLLFDLVTTTPSGVETNSVRHKVGLPAVQWLTQAIDTEGSITSSTSLALDQNGQAHVSYYDASKGDLKHAYQANGGWVIETVDSTNDVGLFSSLALDRAGNPRISYADATLKRLKFAAWNGSAWEIETVYDRVDASSYSSLALDREGSPAIAFMDNTHGDLLYAKKTGANWTVEPVDSEERTGSEISLALDSEDRPMISYRNVTRDDLKFARWNGTEWKIETVDETGSVGFNSSLRIDRNDRPHISYRDRDGSSTHLKYAVGESRGWKLEIVDSSGAVGFDCALALDSQDRPHISYRDSYGGSGDNSLKYAVWNGSFWAISVLDADGSVGWSTSIALDAMDHVRISYRDISQSDLKFASLDASECQIFHAVPVLSITRDQNGVVLSWSSDAQGTLQTAESLANPAWTSAGSGISRQGSSFTARLPLNGKTQFYRLLK